MANAAATIIQRAYITYINMKLQSSIDHHQLNTTLISIHNERLQAISHSLKELHRILQINELLNNNIGTVTGNIVGDNRLLDDNG
jgi:hypothetical protein